MTKYLILVAIILALLYFYWRYQQNKTISFKPEEIIERKGKEREIFWDANDFDLSDNENHD